MKIIEKLKKVMMRPTPPIDTPTARMEPSNVYRHCNEMPLDAFIDAECNGNHARVIKRGKVTPAQVEEAWKCLYSEYCDISDTKPYKHLFSMSMEIGQLWNRLLGVKVCLKVLSVQYVPYCELKLRGMGYNCNLDLKNQAEYAKTLAAIDMKSRTIEIALMQQNKQYEEAIAEFGGKDVTEADFERNLVELSKYMGFRINAKEITVSEYCHIRKKYESEAEALDKINNK